MNPRATFDLYPPVSHWKWFIAAIVYGLFVIYGSLVPLHYQPLDWDTALREFRQIPFLQLDIGHRADWVANILLFIPLNFLWCGVLMRRSQGFGTRFTIALTLIALSCAFAVCIEFTQQWFPPRTVSQNDIVAESIGAVVGCVLWFLCGFAVQEWLSARQRQAAAGPFERALLLYVIGFAIYSVMPLDLTISVAEIYHKFHEGKIELAPKLPTPSTFKEWYGLITDVIVFVPVGVYVRLAARRRSVQCSAVSNVLIATGIASLIELAQVFVYSRYSSVNDVIVGTLGGTIGVVLVRVFAAPQTYESVGLIHARARTGAVPFFVMLTVSAIYALGLCCFFWWPLEPLHDRAEILARLHEFWQVPFKNYYYGTEFHALTALLRKTLLLVPVGFLLGLTVARSGATGTLRRVIQLCCLLGLIALAVGIEAGQAMFPAHYPDVTDSLIYLAGGLTGALLHAKFTGDSARSTELHSPRAGGTLMHSTRR